MSSLVRQNAYSARMARRFFWREERGREVETFRVQPRQRITVAICSITLVRRDAVFGRDLPMMIGMLDEMLECV